MKLTRFDPKLIPTFKQLQPADTQPLLAILYAVDLYTIAQIDEALYMEALLLRQRAQAAQHTQGTTP